MCKNFDWLKAQQSSFQIKTTIIGSACTFEASPIFDNGECIRISGYGADAADPGRYDFRVYEREWSKVCARYFGLKASNRGWNQTSSYNDGAGNDSWNWGANPPLSREARRNTPAVAHVIHGVATATAIVCECHTKQLYKLAART